MRFYYGSKKMILINTNKNKLKRLHMNHMKGLVQKKIMNTRHSYNTSINFIEFDALLNYFSSNLDDILIGDISKLKYHIGYIEKNLYISEKKLNYW